MRSLLFLLIAAVLAWNPLHASNKECFEPGLFCENCQSLVHCTQNEDNTWTKTSQARCPFPQKCISGTCTEEPEPICDGIADLPFICEKVGIFPHPFYCDKFVLCVEDWGLKAFVNHCEDGYGYNVVTADCDIKLEGNQCKEKEYPVPPCAALLQSGALDGDPRIFYTCEEVHKNLFEKVLFPVLDKCEHGQVYDDVDLCHEW